MTILPPVWPAASDPAGYLDPPLAASTLASGVGHTEKFARMASTIEAIKTRIGRTGVGFELSSGTIVRQLADMCRPNLLHNGQFRVNQRGVTVVTPAAIGFTYLIDRWAIYQPIASSCRFTLRTPDTEYPTGSSAPVLPVVAATNGTSLRCERLTGQDRTAAWRVVQVMETKDCLPLAGRACTLSYETLRGVGATATGVRTRIYFGQGTDQGPAGAWTGETSWPAKDSLPDSYTGTWVKSYVSFIAADSQIRVEFSSSPVTAGTAVANDWHEIRNVKLEVDQENIGYTTLAPLPYAQELAICQRYYRTVGNQEMQGQQNGVNTGIIAWARFPPMRIPPAVTLPAIGASSWERSGVGNFTPTLWTFTIASSTSVRIDVVPPAATLNANDPVHYTSNNLILLSADL